MEKGNKKKAPVKKQETAREKILKILDGYSYNEASGILKHVEEALPQLCTLCVPKRLDKHQSIDEQLEQLSKDKLIT